MSENLDEFGNLPAESTLPNSVNPKISNFKMFTSGLNLIKFHCSVMSELILKSRNQHSFENSDDYGT